jgi:glycosyltransferase involved in cell wall biosynthesis
VAFLGWRDNAASLLPAFDLFVLPSRAEGQPFALVEAAAAGLPIIAADASGIAEVLDDGRGGTLVTPGDPEALAAELAEFVADPAPFRARARHGQAQARDRYDAEANLRRTIARWDD